MNLNGRKIFGFYRKKDLHFLFFWLIFLALFKIISGVNIYKENYHYSQTGSFNLADLSREEWNVYNKMQSEIALYERLSNMELFDFDPNIADSVTFIRLGITPRQVSSIMKYRSMGGVYRSPSDFSKLWGLAQIHYKKLEPHIKISSSSPKTISKNKGSYPDAKPVFRGPVSLNTANLEELRSVPSIGFKRARLIFEYGKALGGYINVDQLDEIEGIPMEVKQYFYVSEDSISRLNVNQDTFQKLFKHPYISRRLAAKILWYRKKKGHIESLEDLEIGSNFPKDTLQMLAPYLSF